jgi:hypothetical protein
MAGIPPLVQPANQAPPPMVPAGNNLVIPVRCRTFTQFYEDTSKDPCQGNYTRIFQRFDPENAAAAAPEILFEQALGCSSDKHQAYFCCALTRRGPRIYCMHLPSKFVSALDGHVTPWDNNCYAFLGDVTQDTATTVVFPVTAFTPLAPTMVYTEEYLQANLQALNGVDVFPALPANQANANATPVNTRPLMYLPSRYVPFFLDASGYTMKQVWQVLPQLLAQYQDEVNCQVLLKWLWVASHGTAATNAQGQPIIGPPINTIHLIAPAADKDLILHRHLALKLALPGLGQPAEGLEEALFQMANAMVAQTADQCLA